MIDKWFPAIELPLTIEQFHQLPQNPAYKYEYFNDHAWLSPRPKNYHALLDLKSFVRPIGDIGTDEEVHIRPLADEDWQNMPPVFADAFDRVLPLASLTDEVRVQAAEECLQETREGLWGPLISGACMVAACQSDGALAAALLITLVPAGDPTDWNSWRWKSPPSADVVGPEAGRPHLTWIFVSPWSARQGVGMALLDAAVRALIGLDFSELVSTFLLGNESSTLWHWRAGFRLLPYPGSMRVMQERADRMMRDDGETAGNFDTPE